MPFEVPELPVDPDRARALQRRLAGAVVIPDRPRPAPGTVTGVDVSYDPGSDRLAAAAVTVDAGTGIERERVTVIGRATYPYRPGLLAFREIPALLEAIDRLRDRPELLLCDGQGIAHPRRFGLACHLAVLTGLPAVGVAKTRFVGEHGPVGSVRGSRAPLTDGAELLGYALRTRDGVRPLYVSPGSGIGFDQSCEVVLDACRSARVPDPIRAADRLSRRLVRG
jgi:deoxyribonuclease V